jgi:hypothetical protein
MEVLNQVKTAISRRATSRWLGLPALSLIFGCTGSISSDPGVNTTQTGGSTGAGATGGAPGTGATSGGGVSNTACAAPSPGTAPLRRLSNAEYRNTLNDLFAGVPDIANLVASATRELPPESESLGFRNNAQFLTVQSLTAQKYMDVAEAIAEKAATATGFVPCTPAAGRELECGKTFIQNFGKRAYRRAVTAEEAARFEAQFQSAFTSHGFVTAVEWTVFSILQSPAFLYRVERGAPSSAATTLPTPSETATRLSYLFWQSLPDAALTQLAEGGGLDTPAKIEAQARSMLADPRSDRLFQYFAEWLDLDRLDDFSRDTKVFTGLPANLPALYEGETRAFVRALLTRPDGNFAELLTAPYTYANKSLATFYGLTPPTGDAFERIADPRRSGVLTQAMLIAQDKAYRTSIVRRGLKLRTDFLCQKIPAPPNDVPLNLETSAASASQRERLEQHRSDPSCATCHVLLDPVGLAFESFDAVGRYRTLDEVGEPISTAGQLTGTASANGSFADVRELGALLANSSDAKDCYITQTFRFFFGRDTEPADACSLARLKATFETKNLSLSELFIGLTQTDAFLYRPTLEVSP